MAAISQGELERTVRVRHLPAGEMVLEASEAERARLAGRFGICAVHALNAKIVLNPDGAGVRATGVLTASIQQECAISGESFATIVEESVDLLFMPKTAAPQSGSDEEVELASDELDRIEFSGDSFDLGEAIAQTLGLAIDPYAEGPNAEAVRAEAGIASDDAPTGPLAAALAALKRD